CYESVRSLGVDANTKALSERHEAPEQQRQACQEQQHASPRSHFRMEELLVAHRWPVEHRRKDDVEIEQDERRDQEIFLVRAAKMNCPDPSSLHECGSGQDHSQK